MRDIRARLSMFVHNKRRDLILHVRLHVIPRFYHHILDSRRPARNPGPCNCIVTLAVVQFHSRVRECRTPCVCAMTFLLTAYSWMIRVCHIPCAERPPFSPKYGVTNNCIECWKINLLLGCTIDCGCKDDVDMIYSGWCSE